MKKLLIAGLLALSIPVLSWAGQVPLITGPQDVGNLNGVLNSVITNVNANTQGLLFSAYVAAGNGADTTEDTLYTYTLPANAITANGRGVRIRCFGNVANNADTKTVKTYFGAAVVSNAVTVSTTNVWSNELLVIKAGASASQVTGVPLQGTAINAMYFNADSTDAWNANVTIKCTGQASAANANDVAGQGMIVEVLQ